MPGEDKHSICNFGSKTIGPERRRHLHGIRQIINFESLGEFTRTMSVSSSGRITLDTFGNSH